MIARKPLRCISTTLWLLSLAPCASAQESARPGSTPVPLAATAASDEDRFDLEAALLSPSGGLSAEEAGRRARARAPQVRSASAAAQSAHWDAEAQWSSFLPQLSVAAQYRRINRVWNNVGFSAQQQAELGQNVGAIMDPAVQRVFAGLLEGFESFNFTQPVHSYALSASARIPVSDLFLRVYPSYAAARNVADARAIEVETRSAAADLQAREAFYTYARALATQLVAEQALRQAEAQAAQTKLFVDAGTAAPVDLMTATARVESMRSSLARAKGAVAITRNTLATLTGAPAAEVAPIHERVTALPEPPAGSLDQLLEHAFTQRPELRALRKLLGANEHLKSAERNAALPTLSVEGSALYAQPNPRYVPPRNEFRGSWEVGATLSWTPNGAVVGYQRSQRASAELQKVRADLAALEDGVRIEVVQSYEDYIAADAAARASEAQQRAAEETYRVRMATYRVGAGVQIDLLTADLALTQARLDYVNAVLDARTALARLRKATHGLAESR